eukprot:g23712.t1
MIGSLVAAAASLMLPPATAVTVQNDQKLGVPDAQQADLKPPTPFQPWHSRISTVLRVAGFLSMVKLITSTANSMASSTQNLVLKNQLGFAEADLGLFMSAQFAFGAVANAVLLGPVTRIMGGAPRSVVRNCVLAMAGGYALQSLLNSMPLALPLLAQKSCFTSIALILATFQYSLSTSITAENTQLVPEDMKGTLIGMEHCIFSAARVVTPAVGISVLNDYGMGGLYGACSSIFVGTFLFLQERRVHQEELEIQQEQLLAAPPAPPDLGDALGALSRAYAGTGFGDDTADWEGVLSVDGINGFSNSALYGEINEQDFAELIFDLGLRPPAIIYDLGSGTGKLVNLAALIGFSATGIELEPGRHQRACTAARTLLRQVGDSLGGQPPRFLHTSFLEFDFSDADCGWDVFLFD